MALVEILKTAGENTTGLDSLVDLNPFAVQYRYESLDSDDDEIDRSTVLTEVQSVFNRVDDLIDRAERGS